MRERLMQFLMCLLALACLSVGMANAGEVRIGDTPVLPVLTTLDGKTIDPAKLRGKVVVLSYFASYCPFCMIEAPKLQKLYREHADRLVVIGVNIEHKDAAQKEKAVQWVEKYRLTHPVTTDYLSLEQALGKRKGLPVNYVFDARGVVRRIDVGELFDEDFDDIARMARQR